MQNTKNTTGIVTKALQEIFDATFALYWKTHSYHWNIEHEDFFPLHKALNDQYDELWEAVDAIAERMRVLKSPAPSNLPAQTALKFGTSRDAILKDLLKGHEAAILLLKKNIRVLDENDDIAGADFLTGLLASHEKTAWMLRASQ